MKPRVRSLARILAMTALLVLAWPVGIARPDEPFDQVRYPAGAMSPLSSPCGAVHVFDYDGVEQDWDWLVATFGEVWIEPGDGSVCLTELRAIRDDSTLNVLVEDSEGRPVDGIPVVFHWSDAPLLPPELVGCYDRGVYGGTGEHIQSAPGMVGFGMGSGAYYCPPGGGPHTVWVGVEGSDCVHGLGMLCWTNHYHVNPTFVLAGESLPSPTLAPISNADGDGNYLVDWSTVAGATAYTLEEDDNYAFTSPTVRYAGGGTQYPISGQHAGTWHYRVRASNAGGDSPWSNTESAVVDDVPPDAPILYPISNPDGNGDYWADWSDVAGGTKYRLEEDDNPAFSSPIVRYIGYSTLYYVSGRLPGVRYYRVRTSNAAGFSPWSNPEMVVVQNVPPDAPILYPISNPDGDGSYLVDWSAVSGGTKYRLEEDDNPAFSSPIVRYLGYSTQCQVTGRQPGVLYYRVRTSNAAGYGLWSNTQSVTVAPGGAWYRPAGARMS